MPAKPRRRLAGALEGLRRTVDLGLGRQPGVEQAAWMRAEAHVVPSAVPSRAMGANFWIHSSGSMPEAAVARGR